MLTLFDATSLFDEGKKRYTHFDLPNAELQLWEQFIGKQDADRYYQTLLDATPWKQRERKMYDKLVLDPRLTAWYGINGLPFTKELLEIKALVEAASAIVFDSVLLNLYRDGNDSVAWHSDTLPSDGKHKRIASVSFGETRPFQVRHKTNRFIKPISIPLTHGSFLLMGSTMQEHYEHHIPKTAKQVAPRINLTFRIAAPSATLEQ
jgi:alkylated DNA repair dioxygenase AlkB